MRDRILELLKQRGHPLPADQVLREALGIHSPNTATADRVLKAILRHDPGFRNSAGRWSLAGEPRSGLGRSPARAAILFVEKAKASRDLTHNRGAVTIPEESFTASFGLGGKGPRPVTLRRIRRAMEGRVLVCWSEKEAGLWRRILKRFGAQEWDGDTIELRGLAERIMTQDLPVREPADLVPSLGLPAPESADPAAMARFMAGCWQALLEQAPEERRCDAQALRHWIEEAKPKADFSKFGFGAAFLCTLPASPGVYVMKNRADDIIYVGKSRNLRRRVRSYFTSAALRDAKVRRIHEQLHTIETIATANEVEALMLEMRMIRDFRPPINLQEEVHEQPQAYGRQWNCLLLVPASDEQTADIYFLRDGSFVARTDARMGQPATRRLCSRLKSLYFGRRRRSKGVQEEWETEIVSRWLSANRRRLNFLDIDEAGTCETAVRRLSDYLLDRDRLARKVIYR